MNSYHNQCSLAKPLGKCLQMWSLEGGVAGRKGDLTEDIVAEKMEATVGNSWPKNNS